MIKQAAYQNYLTHFTATLDIDWGNLKNVREDILLCSLLALQNTANSNATRAAHSHILLGSWVTFNGDDITDIHDFLIFRRWCCNNSSDQRDDKSKD
ncbi:uncharacterized protein N7483_007254 [Penicillium malachiteum]|uniref:uncharacterized protein n=1 Tax=Penicillium malachiteum TaxID=1324776 RepID=UPI002547D767|nr:uncharacterized protein N7483_007254 [Penicillium malachiteum]KAJ5725897.1 hypothetical protein N7483_007254 [Penicillium malachiteum]